jgi:trans-2,3-dihydro-3-hydroxyanthranilate isomerase
MQYFFYTADVFTDRIFGGNPLAVFPDAQGLSDRQMQQVAAEFNYSETVFVLPPQTLKGTRKLRIFTPKTELPFAGHPTVGTAFVLASIAQIPLTGTQTPIIFEEGVGLVPVTLYAQSHTQNNTHNNQPIYAELTAAQSPEWRSDVPSSAELAALLSLEPEAIGSGNFTPQAVSCGVPFLFVPLRDRLSLSCCRLNRDRWQSLLAQHWASALYLFCPGIEGETIDFHARMFAPSMGIEEDPATGSAATAFGGYLGLRQDRQGSFEWHIEQGADMGRTSHLWVKIDRHLDQIQNIRVGGASVLVSEGSMEIPEE